MQAWKLYIGEASNGNGSEVNKDASTMNWIVVAVVDVLKICISGSVSVCLFYLKLMRKVVATTCSDCNRSYLKINEIGESSTRLPVIGWKHYF